jgi:serine/threonine protein phosphatase PrpC
MALYLLDQITEDQTWVAQAVKRKALTVDQARSHPLASRFVPVFGSR